MFYIHHLQPLKHNILLLFKVQCFYHHHLQSQNITFYCCRKEEWSYSHLQPPPTALKHNILLLQKGGMVLLPPLIASKHNILLLQKGTMFSTAKDPTANRNMISILHRQGSVLPTTYSFHNPLHYNCVPPQNEGALIQATVLQIIIL